MCFVECELAEPFDAYLFKVSSVSVVEADEWCEVVGGWVVVRDKSVNLVICVWFDEC